MVRALLELGPVRLFPPRLARFARFAERSPFVLAMAAALSTVVFALGGCETRGCDSVIATYDVSLERGVSVADGAPLAIEACVDDTCSAATPDAEGGLSFSGRDGPIPLVTGRVERGAGAARIAVQLQVAEKSDEHVTLRVTRGGTTLLAERVPLGWAEDADGCHEHPTSTRL